MQAIFSTGCGEYREVASYKLSNDLVTRNSNVRMYVGITKHHSSKNAYNDMLSLTLSYGSIDSVIIRVIIRLDHTYLERAPTTHVRPVT